MATDSKPQLPLRPTMLTVLAWIWIALGTFFTLTSLFVAVAVLLVPEFSPRLPEGDRSEFGIPGMEVMDWLFGYFRELVMLQLLVAAAILVGGIFLLKQRAWARTLLETVSWLGLAYTVLFTAWFVYAWLEMSEVDGTTAAGDPTVGILRAFGVGAALLSVLFYGVPLGALIWMLRHRDVRGALIRGTGARDA